MKMVRGGEWRGGGNAETQTKRETDVAIQRKRRRERSEL